MTPDKIESGKQLFKRKISLDGALLKNFIFVTVKRKTKESKESAFSQMNSTFSSQLKSIQNL